MKKSDLVREIARRNGGNASDAADQVDRAVNQIIRILRGGKPARLPGLGTINPGKQWTFKPERHDSR
jgi:nucleoid DNA-binding protein